MFTAMTGYHCRSDSSSLPGHCEKSLDMDLSRKLSARTILGTGRKETRLGTIPVLFNQDVVRMKFVRSIKTAINRDILKKGDVEYGTS